MDLEMTGLDPSVHTIVEIATIVTDDDLNILAEGPDIVVHQPPEALAVMGDVVRTMHTKSGLLHEIESSTVSLADAGATTLEFIKAHTPEPRSVPLAGNSIGTDRRFLAIWLPAIDDWLHYLSVDV
jgi:oligoribonuclease